MNLILLWTVIFPIGVVFWIAVITAIWNLVSNIRVSRKMEMVRLQRYELMAEAARILYDNMISCDGELGIEGFEGKPVHFINSDHWALKQWQDVLYNRPLKTSSALRRQD